MRFIASILLGFLTTRAVAEEREFRCPPTAVVRIGPPAGSTPLNKFGEHTLKLSGTRIEKLSGNYLGQGLLCFYSAGPHAQPAWGVQYATHDCRPGNTWERKDGVCAAPADCKLMCNIK